MSDTPGRSPNPFSEINPPARPAAAAQSMAGERRVITVLFCDVVGSTSLASRFDPEEWAEVMNEAFRYMIAPIEEYGGMVARLMGDAVLAFFGAPQAHEDDPQRAVLAGLGIINGIQPFIHQFEQDYSLAFNVRVGINTGPVVVGEMGGGQSGEYTAMGDAINVAARMEQTAAPGTVQIAEDTYRAIAPLFDVWDLGGIAVKGKDEPVQAYRVLGLETQPGRLRGLEGIRSPLIGRERELGRLRETLAGLRDGQSRVCFLIGEAGLGKTRLIAEMRRAWRDLRRDQWAGGADEPNPAWLGWTEFAAVSYGASRPYDLLKQQLRTYTGIRETDPPDVIHARLETLTSAYPPALHERMHRVFGYLLGDTAAGGAFETGEAFQRELRGVIEQMAQVQTSRGPAVYVVDDVHWADVASLDTLRNLLPLVEKRPVLFLFAMRPDWSAPGWQLYMEAQLEYPAYATSIYLEPLSSGDTRALIHELLENANAPERIYQLIERKAEGNPFFVEETVRTLIDSGALRRDEQVLCWDESADVERIADLIGLPGNVQALLTARIDQLDPDVRRTMQLAAVIGRSFPLRVLERISDRPAGVLADHLKRLAQADLVRPSLSDAESEYAFRHALTRDAAYETILLRQRRRYHRRVAEAFEALYAERLADEAPQLALHFAEARDWGKAIHYYALAGASAAQLYANAEAIEQYRQALEIAVANPGAAGEETLVELFRALGRVYEVAGRYEEALAHYRRLEVLGRETGRPSLALEGLMAQLVIYVTPTDHMDAARGRVLIDEVLALGASLGRHDAQARAYWCLMLLHMNADPNPEQAVADGERALAIAREHGLPEIEAFVLNDIGRAYGIVGRREESFAAFAQARALWEQAGNEPMIADSLGVSSTGYMLIGDLAQAADHAGRGLELSRRIGNVWVMALNGFTLGYVLLEQGRIGEAIRLLEAAVDWAEQAHFVIAQAEIPLALSWVFWQLGAPGHRHEWREQLMRRSAAAELLPKVEALWRAVDRLGAGDADGAAREARIAAGMPAGGSGLEEPLVAPIIAAALSAAGDYVAALDAADAALAHMDETRLDGGRADVLIARGDALTGLGRAAEATLVWRDALALARRLGARRAEWLALARLCRHAAEPAPPAEYRRAAAEVVGFLAAQIDDGDLRRAFLVHPDARPFLDGGAS